MSSPPKGKPLVRKQSVKNCYESHTHGLGEPVYLTQPLQLRAPFFSDHAKIMRRHRSWFSFDIETEDAMQRDTPAGYWVVRNLGVLRRKRDIACLGEMDTTSVFAFRDVNGKGPASAKDEEELVAVRYDQPLTLYTNFGMGGRFLAPVPGNIFQHNAVGWQTTAEEMQQASCFRDIGFACQWIVRRGPSQTASPPPSGSPQIRRRLSSTTDPDIVRCGDYIMLESVEHPGHYCAMQKNVICISPDTDGAELQLVAPSLRFAIQLREKTPMYRKASSALNLKELGLEERKGVSIRDVLPKEIIAYCFSFHQGCTPAEHSRQSAFQLQQLHDQRPLSQRRDGMASLRAIRAVCSEWRFLANHLVSSIRVGFMCDVTAKKQRRMLFDMVTGCKNLTSLSLRNLDSLQDEDVIQLARNTNLRCLNLGGCYKITDRSADVLARLPLIHLNVAMTEITDRGLRAFANHLTDLCTLNLYGIQNITEEGVGLVLARCPRLTSINLRGTSLTHEATMRLRDLARNSGCDILTGAMLSSSVYGTPTSNQPAEAEPMNEQATEETRSERSDDHDASVDGNAAPMEARTIAPFSNGAAFSPGVSRAERKEDEEEPPHSDQRLFLIPEAKSAPSSEAATPADSKASVDDRSSFVRDSLSEVRELLDVEEIFSEEETQAMLENGLLTPRSEALHRRRHLFDADAGSTAANEITVRTKHAASVDYRRIQSAYNLSNEPRPSSPAEPPPQGSQSPSFFVRRRPKRRGSDANATKSFFFRRISS